MARGRKGVKFAMTVELWRPATFAEIVTQACVQHLASNYFISLEFKPCDQEISSCGSVSDTIWLQRLEKAWRHYFFLALIQCILIDLKDYRYVTRHVAWLNHHLENTCNNVREHQTWYQNHQCDLVFILKENLENFLLKLKTSGSFKGSDVFLCDHGDRISHHLTAVSVNKIFTQRKQTWLILLNQMQEQEICKLELQLKLATIS